MTSNVSNDSEEGQRIPASTRLSRLERGFLKVAVAKIQQGGRDNFHVSDFLREAGVEKAEQVLGQSFADYSAAA